VTCAGLTNSFCDGISTAPVPFSQLGSNLYGWFPNQEITGLPIDNTLLRSINCSKGNNSSVNPTNSVCN
jgi:hypothetical protein